MSLRLTADGSVERDDGTVLQFSVERFVREVSTGRCCLICGRQRGLVEFSQEHVLPDWLLRRFHLHARAIRLPSQTGFTYGQYTVPCCLECNRRMGTQMETPVREILTGGYHHLAAQLRPDGQRVLYAWLALVFLKTHLRDLTLRFERDERIASPNIGELYNWEELHHIHCLARSVYTGAVMGDGTIGSLMVLPAATVGAMEPFDYADLYSGRAVLVRIDDICVIAILNDGSAALTAYRSELERIGGGLSPLQMREIMVRVAYLNMRLRDRPAFSSTIDSHGQLAHLASMPETITFDEGNASGFGALFYNSIADILRLSQDGAEVGNKVRSGMLTFLQDDSGQFNTRSMIFD